MDLSTSGATIAELQKPSYESRAPKAQLGKRKTLFVRDVQNPSAQSVRKRRREHLRKTLYSPEYKKELNINPSG